MITALHQLWAHSVWADRKIWQVLQDANVPAPALREFAHILGAQEVWLSRLEGRPSAEAVWPDPNRASMGARLNENIKGMNRFIAGLDDSALATMVHYTNTAGEPFVTPMQEILFHMMLHSQYHRGKVNQELAVAGLPVAPVDFIAYVRGAPAATQR